MVENILDIMAALESRVHAAGANAAPSCLVDLDKLVAYQKHRNSLRRIPR